MKPIKTAIISAMVLALGTGSSLAMNKDIVDTAAERVAVQYQV